MIFFFFFIFLQFPHQVDMKNVVECQKDGFFCSFQCSRTIGCTVLHSTNVFFFIIFQVESISYHWICLFGVFVQILVVFFDRELRFAQGLRNSFFQGHKVPISSICTVFRHILIQLDQTWLNRIKLDQKRIYVVQNGLNWF